MNLVNQLPTKHRRVLTGLWVVPFVFLAACATRPSSVAPQSIDPRIYSSYSCDQLNSTLSGLMANEQNLSAQMSASANSQVVTNVLGGLLAATVGIGFASGVDNSGQAMALSETRGHIAAVRGQAGIKACALPQAINAAR